MSSKIQRRTGQVHRGYVNTIILEGLTDNERLVSVTVDPKEFVSEECILVRVDEGISMKVAIRGLRWIISFLEREGLPLEPKDELVPRYRLRGGYSIRALKTPRESIGDEVGSKKGKPSSKLFDIIGAADVGFMSS